MRQFVPIIQNQFWVLFPLFCMQLILIYYTLTCIFKGFPRKLIIKTFNLGFAFFTTYAFMFVIPIGVQLVDFSWSLQKSLLVLYIKQLYPQFTAYFICVLFLRGYVSALDEEYFQHYHGENARGQSVAIEHVPSMFSQKEP